MMVNGLGPAAGFWGGALVEDDGRQHFLDGDEWMKGNKARKGPPSEEEYAIGFSGWLLHEFNHYLFHTYAEFKLETVDHQWWYREQVAGGLQGAVRDRLLYGSLAQAASGQGQSAAAREAQVPGRAKR